MKNLKWILPLLMVAVLAGIYFIPVQKVSFEQLYAKVDPQTSQTLVAFRNTYPTKAVQVDGIRWDYVILGHGQNTILFLHGMTGSYDIWWRQIEALRKDYRIISVTYPALNSLEKMGQGILTILDQEKIGQVDLVGTSLGGYFTQYLLTRHPNRIRQAVFANTFPPNKIIAEKNKTIGRLLPYLPEWLVIKVFRKSFKNSIYPASGNHELNLAFLNEIGSGRMTRAQVVGRYRCVVETFAAPGVREQGIPIMIIESDNDPLVEPALREALKTTYSGASVFTFHNAGHFPYLNHAAAYTDLLKKFFKTPTKNETERREK